MVQADLDRCQQPRQIHRFQNVIERAKPQSILSNFPVRQACKENHARTTDKSMNFPEDFHSADTRKEYIQ